MYVCTCVCVKAYLQVQLTPQILSFEFQRFPDCWQQLLVRLLWNIFLCHSRNRAGTSLVGYHFQLTYIYIPSYYQAVKIMKELNVKSCLSMCWLDCIRFTGKALSVSLLVMLEVWFNNKMLAGNDGWND